LEPSQILCTGCVGRASQKAGEVSHGANIGGLGLGS
jgi:hypothetical protein